jgi:flagellar biosynthesis GTPase FlhF
MSVYRGRTVDELIPQIQRDLGSDAIIVRRREGLTGGVLGFFQHPFVEIEALPGAPRIDVYDEPDSAVPPRAAALPPPPAAPMPTAAPLEAQRTASALSPAPVPPAAPAQIPPAPPPFYVRDPAAPTQAQAGSAYVTAHLAALARAGPRPRMAQPGQPPARPVDFQELLARDIQQPPAPPRRTVDYDLERSATQRAAAERRAVAPGSQARARAGVERNLRRFGVSEEFARELIDGASVHMLPFAPRAGLAQAVRLMLAQRIPVATALPSTGAALVVVGAGGAGKTTCCAALLGAYRKAGMLPASCATLIRTPELSMILSPQILKAVGAGTPRALRALRKVKGEGLAVVDTPRLSPADRGGIRELAAVLEQLKPERVLVALPVTLSAAAAAQLLEALEPLGADGLVLTHAEETDQIGVAVEAACRFDLAPEYMLDRARTGGWRLTRVDPTGLAARMLP